MAAWDSPDLLARVKRWMRRPTDDAAWPDDDIYALLTESEAQYKPVLAIHAPADMWSAPVKLTSSDGGVTFAMPSGVPYIRFQLLESLSGFPLSEGPFWSHAHDYVLEDGKIRMTRGVARSFADGPYFRGITPPGTIDDSTDSTILPERHRIVLVYDTLKRWAEISGQRDPRYFEGRLQEELYGNPNTPGHIGIIGQAKLRNQDGAGRYAESGPKWWRPV